MIFDIIEELRSDNSRLFKEKVLEKYKDNELFKKVLYYTLSPRKQYYIKKIPKYDSNITYLDNTLTYDMIFAFLDDANAIDTLKGLLSGVQSRDAKVLELIIQRDLKCGVNESTVNKIFPGLIEETPYMRCLSADWVLEMDNGSTHTIQDIVDNGVGGRVKSLNLENGNVEYKNIVNRYNNGDYNSDWYIITYEDDEGNIVKTPPITGNHIVYTAGGREIRVDELDYTHIIL